MYLDVEVIDHNISNFFGLIVVKDTVYPLSMIFYKAIFSVIIINSQ